MQIVIVGDTHGDHRKVQFPKGDLLLHVGDALNFGSFDELRDWVDWIENECPFERVIYVAGNHDVILQSKPTVAMGLLLTCKKLDYLQDKSVTIDGVKFWGSPWQPFFKAWAFNLETEEELDARFAKIPKGVDILMTHTPPNGILDSAWRTFAGTKYLENCGPTSLLKHVKRVRPSVHAFGHIHRASGVEEQDGTLYVNASLMDDDYNMVNRPTIVDFDERDHKVISWHR